MGEEQGLSTDVYALGWTLYEIMGGKIKFNMSKMEMMASRIFGESYVLPEGLVDGRIADIVNACIAKEPKDRLDIQKLIEKITDFVKILQDELGDEGEKDKQAEVLAA